MSFNRSIQHNGQHSNDEAIILSKVRTSSTHSKYIENYLKSQIASVDKGSEFFRRNEALLTTAHQTEVVPRLIDDGYDAFLFQKQGEITGHFIFQRIGDTLHTFSIKNSGEYLLKMFLSFRDFVISSEPQVDKIRIGIHGLDGKVLTFFKNIKRHETRYNVRIEQDGEIFVRPKPYIHPNAVVESGATIGPFSTVAAFAVVEKGSSIGSYSDICSHTVIKRGAKIGDYNFIDSHCVLNSFVTMGDNNRLGSFVSLGGEPEMRTDIGECGSVCVGDNNRFFEQVVVHRGTGPNGLTRVGNENLFMHGSHIAHDCTVGDGCTIVDGVKLGGFVTLENRVYLSAGVQIAPKCKVGSFANIFASANVVGDIPPYCLAATPRNERVARLIGINKTGLKILGFSEESISSLTTLFRRLFIYRHQPSLQEREVLDEHGIVLADFCSDANNKIIASSRGSRVGRG